MYKRVYTLFLMIRKEWIYRRQTGNSRSRALHVKLEINARDKYHDYHHEHEYKRVSEVLLHYEYNDRSRVEARLNEPLELHEVVSVLVQILRIAKREKYLYELRRLHRSESEIYPCARTEARHAERRVHQKHQPDAHYVHYF